MMSMKGFLANARSRALAEIEALKHEPAPAIYRLPVSMTGLQADVDSCDPPATLVPVEPGDPLSPGCVDRYLTTDGHLIDCSIDSIDFGQWFEEELEEVEAENAKLQADNTSLVEQMNQMALQPNQEVIEWHSYPEEKPEPSRCCIVERKNFCYHIAHHSEINGWLDSVIFDVLSDVKAWAYLPKGYNHE